MNRQGVRIGGPRRTTVPPLPHLTGEPLVGADLRERKARKPSLFKSVLILLAGLFTILYLLNGMARFGGGTWAWLRVIHLLFGIALVWHAVGGIREWSLRRKEGTHD